MTLSDGLRKKLLNRFDQLIKEGSTLLERIRQDYASYVDVDHLEGYSVFTESGLRDHVGAYTTFETKVESLLEYLFGDSHRGKELQRRVPGHNLLDSAEVMVGILIGLRDDLENDFLADLAKQIEEQVAVDYVNMAESLLGESDNLNSSHIPAAVIAGVVLERAVRELCLRQEPPIEVKKNENDYHKLDTLISSLKGVIRPVEADQLRSWAKIRNSAAHGRNEEIKRTDVTLMISGIRNFLAAYL
jgi:hypothetical protein